MFIIQGVYAFVSIIIDVIGTVLGYLLETISTPFVLLFSWMVEQSSISETSITRLAWGLLAFCVIIIVASLALRYGIMAILAIGIVIPAFIFLLKFFVTLFIFILLGKICYRLFINFKYRLNGASK